MYSGLSRLFAARVRKEAVMGTATRPLEELIKELPPDAQAEVRDFVEFLLTRRARKAKGGLRQDWAGALREHRERYTSLDLQRCTLEWRGD